MGINLEYKLSKFNCIVNSKRNTLIFNSLLNTFSVMNNNLLDNNLSKLTKEEKKKLIGQGILVKSDTSEDEKARNKLKKIVNSEILELTILPTLQCQFRCTYCYEEKTDWKIDNSTEIKILKFIEKNIAGKKGVKISWFGGEPLLEKQTVFKITKKAKELCKKNHIPFYSDMTTNAYSLDLETFKKCLSYGINCFQITIDGTKEIHDKLRVLINKKGTFDTIMKNLVSIKESINKKISFTIAIRINFVKESILKFEEIIDFFDGTFGDDNRFYIFMKTVGDYGGEIVNKIADQLVDKDGFPDIDLSKKKIAITKYSFINDVCNICYAAKKNSFVIMPDATVKKCTVSLDNKTNLIGFIDEDGNLVSNSEIKKWNFENFSIKLPKCKKCVFYANCFLLGCPFHPIGSAMNCKTNEIGFTDILKLYKSEPELFLKIGE